MSDLLREEAPRTTALRAPDDPSTPEPEASIPEPAGPGEWVSPVGELIAHALAGGDRLTLENRSDQRSWIDWCHDSPDTRRL